MYRNSFELTITLKYLLESMGVKDLSAAIHGAIVCINIIQVLSFRWQLNPPFLSCSNNDLTKPGERVAAWLEVPVPSGSSKKQDQCCQGRASRHPESERPHAFIFKVSQNSVGKERTQIQSQVKVAKEGNF